MNPTLHPSVLTAEPGQSDVLGGKHTARLELFSVTWLPTSGDPSCPSTRPLSPTVEKSGLQVSSLQFSESSSMLVFADVFSF